jgi:hypothetical protein
MLWRTRVVVCYSTEAFDNDWSGYSIKFDTRSIHIRQRSCRSAGQIQQANGSEHAFCSYPRRYRRVGAGTPKAIPYASYRHRGFLSRPPEAASDGERPYAPDQREDDLAQ